MKRTTLISCFMWLAVLLGGTGSAATKFTATLDGSQNVPPFDVPSTGTAVMFLSDDNSELSFDIQIFDLTTPEIGAHFHNGGPRENGPAVFSLPLGDHKVGVWAIPADMATELLAGRMYINIHTELYTAGEIRGNIREAPLPVRPSSWGAVKSHYGGIPNH